jgi:putative tryptophan/tyrosine transport system substrate-binding protein
MSRPELGEAMRRREVFPLLVGIAAWPFIARAQERVRRIVNLSSGAESDTAPQEMVATLRNGLRKVGWIDGRNIKLEVRWQAARADQAKAYVAQLVADGTWSDCSIIAYHACR